MAAKEEIIPDYLYAFTDEASLLAKIQLRFDALSTLFDMRLETEVEAIGHKEKAVWVDDAPRWDGQRACHRRYTPTQESPTRHWGRRFWR